MGQYFLVNPGELLLVPYTKGFGRITYFRGNDLTTMPFAVFCSDMLSSNSFLCTKKAKISFKNTLNP